MAYLEKLRLDKLRQGCVVIQKHIRGWLQRKKFLRERRAALIIQQYFRGQQTVRYVGTKKTCAIKWLSSPSPRGAGPPFSCDPGADASVPRGGREPPGEMGVSSGAGGADCLLSPRGRGDSQDPKERKP